ncbi:hypothetical protein PoB_002165800 [Plakobranchus ocellatus]|uniref:Uncharacterized protein n=1 Tax=Plakobranchus ocellatus TaxID=259542 RepID=A0AAV3ZKX0_9GAST|nr:hypothetical protein PoB_002165800 [Plakobranchus ocellatus]
MIKNARFGGKSAHVWLVLRQRLHVCGFKYKALCPTSIFSTKLANVYKVYRSEIILILTDNVLIHLPSNEPFDGGGGYELASGSLCRFQGNSNVSN